MHGEMISVCADHPGIATGSRVLGQFGLKADVRALGLSGFIGSSRFPP